MIERKAQQFQFLIKKPDPNSIDLNQKARERNRIRANTYQMSSENRVNLRFYVNEFFISLLNLLRIASQVFYEVGLLEQGLKMIKLALKIAKGFKDCMNNDIIRSISKIYMFYARIQLEQGNEQVALDFYEKCFEFYIREISLIFNPFIGKTANHSLVKHKVKCKASTTMFLIMLMCMIRIYERRENLEKIIQLAHLGYWLMKRLIPQTSEIYSVYSSFKAMIDHKYKQLYIEQKDMVQILEVTHKWFNLHISFYQEPKEIKEAKIKAKMQAEVGEKKVNTKGHLRKVLNFDKFVIVRNKKPVSVVSFKNADPMNKFRIARRGSITRSQPDQKIHKNDSEVISQKNLEVKMGEEEQARSQPRLKYKDDHSIRLLDDVEDYFERRPSPEPVYYGNHFHRSVSVSSDRRVAMKEYYLDSKKYEIYQNQRKDRLRDAFGDLFFFRGLDHKKKKTIKERKRKQIFGKEKTKVHYTGYSSNITKVEQEQKIREEYEKKLVNLDHFFENKINRDLNNKKKSSTVVIKSVDEIRDDAMNRIFIDATDKSEFNKLRDFLRTRKHHSSGVLDDLKFGNKDAIFEEKEGILMGQRQAMIGEVKKVVENQKWRRDIYQKYYFNKNRTQSEDKNLTKNKRKQIIQKWKKAIKTSLLLSRRVNLLGIVKRHPEVFRSSNITNMRKRTWKMFNEMPLEDQQKNVVSHPLKGFTKEQISIINRCKHPKKGSKDPLKNYLQTKDKIIDKLNELGIEKWDNPDNYIVRNQREGESKVKNTIKRSKRRKMKKNNSMELREGTRFSRMTQLSKSTEKFAIFAGLKKKIKSFEEVVDVTKKLMKNGVYIDEYGNLSMSETESKSNRQGSKSPRKQARGSAGAMWRVKSLPFNTFQQIVEEVRKEEGLDDSENEDGDRLVPVEEDGGDGGGYLFGGGGKGKGRRERAGRDIMNPVSPPNRVWGGIQRVHSMDYQKMREMMKKGTNSKSSRYKKKGVGQGLAKKKGEGSGKRHSDFLGVK